MTLQDIRQVVGLALVPVQQALGELKQAQRELAAKVSRQGECLARLDERTARRAGWGRLNGHAKTMGGAGMMAVVWALVEIIQVLIAAP